MYATVTRDDTGHIVVYGPHVTPAIAPNDGAVTAAICPPGAVDPTTGTLAEA
ncbi:hypothetical protein [Micromonospora sp. HUAS LYJ1]|uniref:hypothetical protein n=1 Tax=Micromonospora sp. HUAS LYJ1 TaxID=3061626 RepID=UPI00267239E1|nr:hypothetical protein [Micromonospora sp. HUAS LYJ1]WKU03995.1 hypothetical protein Q2K16_24640 [Micromonospora sp. HUAS LYJ1]